MTNYLNKSGIPDLLFLEGCPPSCTWSSNPEALPSQTKVSYNYAQCTACYGCMAVCPAGAIYPDNGKISIGFDACETCDGKPCIASCRFGAITEFSPGMV